MSRVFRRGELKRAVLHALAETGPANGYVIMQALAERIGGGWRPSPGAIYPALLALEDTGLITVHVHGETRTYALSATGRREHERAPDLLDAVAARVTARPIDRSLGSLLDEFAATYPRRSQRVGAEQADAISAALASTVESIETIANHRST